MAAVSMLRGLAKNEADETLGVHPGVLLGLLNSKSTSKYPGEPACSVQGCLAFLGVATPCPCSRCELASECHVPAATMNIIETSTCLPSLAKLAQTRSECLL